MRLYSALIYISPPSAGLDPVYLRGTPTPIMALVTLATFLLMPFFLANHVLADECHLTPVIHVLQVVI